MAVDSTMLCQIYKLIESFEGDERGNSKKSRFLLPLIQYCGVFRTWNVEDEQELRRNTVR